MSSFWPSIGLILLIWRAQPVQSLVQNITIDALGNSNHPTRVGSGRLEYLPSLKDWTFADNVPTAINSSTVRTVRENATLVFHINGQWWLDGLLRVPDDLLRTTEPSTFFFWHGFLPESAARYSVCIDCSTRDETGDVVTLTSDATTTDGNRSSPVCHFEYPSLALSPFGRLFSTRASSSPTPLIPSLFAIFAILSRALSAHSSSTD